MECAERYRQQLSVYTGASVVAARFWCCVTCGVCKAGKLPLNWAVVCGYAHTHPLDCYGSLHFQYPIMKFIS